MHLNPTEGIRCGLQPHAKPSLGANFTLGHGLPESPVILEGVCVYLTKNPLKGGKNHVDLQRAENQSLTHDAHRIPKFTGSPTCASFWNFLPARPRGPLCPLTAQRLEVQPRPRVGVFMLPPGPRAHGALLDLRGLWVPYTRPCDRGRLPHLRSREASGADPPPPPAGLWL